MRSFIAYLLLFAVMLPTLTPWGTIAYFNINRVYISKVLCENRSKPMLNCNGRCYLAKKLKKQQDKADKETRQRIENLPIATLFFYTLEKTGIPSFFIQKRQLSFVYKLGNYRITLRRLLKPPRF